MTWKTDTAKKSPIDRSLITEDGLWNAFDKEPVKKSRDLSTLYFLCLMFFVSVNAYFIFIFYGISWSQSKFSEFSLYSQNDPRQSNYDNIFKKVLNSIDFKTVTCQSDLNEAQVSPFKEFRIVCYYVIPSNATHSRQLPPSYVDPYLCTHIIVGFASITNGTIDPGPGDVLMVYKTMTAFKKMNPSLKVLLSVEDFSSDGQFGKMVANEDLRAKFSSHVISFLESMEFDGIDLDWEFPSWPAPDEDQRKNFTLLLQNIRKEIVAHNNQSYILSVAVAAPEAIIDQSYNISDIARYADFINLMSYDYHMYTEYLPLTGPNAPLFSRPIDKGFMLTMNVNWSATHWSQCGMPIEKINIGIPTYGHSFSLVNENNNGWNAPANGFGKVGRGGFTSYPDACHFISNPETTTVFDENYLVPYLYRDKEWISYENTMSVDFKAKFIKENKFGGAMIYSLNSDDFYGECGTIKFPLLRQITNILSHS